MMEAPTRNETVDVPSDLSSVTSKLVFLSLRQRGSATVSELADGLHMQKLTLYSVLDTLAGKGLVTVDGETYTAAA